MGDGIEDAVRAIFVCCAALTVAACGGGGGGGGGVVSTPVPVPNPAPSPPPSPPPVPGGIYLIDQIAGSTTLAGKGASSTSGGTFSLSDSDQLTISYSAASGNYTVTYPTGPTGVLVDDPLSSSGSGPETVFLGAGGYVVAYASSDGLKYSNLVGWSYDYTGPTQRLGYLAFGIPTAPGSVPVSGSASYSARLMGHSNETYFDNLVGGLVNNGIQGTMSLAFNFGAGTLAGSLTAFLDVPYQTPLGTFAFTNTVYSTGALNFSGAFATSALGLNSFSGQFVGPAAQELIGNFALPYVSPIDGKAYQSAGAFVGKKSGAL